MASLVPSYLRLHRRAWGLTQKELARLIGCRSSTHVSRLERGIRIPRLKTALACEALFGVPARDMFPKLYKEVEEDVIRDAYVLHNELAKDTSAVVMRKKQLLDEALRRAINS